MGEGSYISLALTRQNAYHSGMPNVLHWTLVFTQTSLEHLAERNIDAEDVTDAVLGRYGTARVRKGGERPSDTLVCRRSIGGRRVAHLRVT